MEDIMFADTLLESSPHPGHRSTWTKLASAMVQTVALATLLAIPLFKVERLHIIPLPPSIQMTSLPEPIMRAQPATASYSASPATAIVEPRYIPSISRGDQKAQAVGAPLAASVPCLVPCEGNRAILTNIIRVGPQILLRQPPAPPIRPLHVSEMQLGGLIHKVIPEYPIIAKQIRMQGSVVLRATIGKDGHVEHVQPVSGPPLLLEPARRAVEQWQYRPYLLNHQPVEVFTQITVNFILNSN
jgi:protein TonB